MMRVTYIIFMGWLVPSRTLSKSSRSLPNYDKEPPMLGYYLHSTYRRKQQKMLMVVTPFYAHRGLDCTDPDWRVTIPDIRLLGLVLVCPKMTSSYGTQKHQNGTELPPSVSMPFELRLQYENYPCLSFHTAGLCCWNVIETRNKLGI